MGKMLVSALAALLLLTSCGATKTSKLMKRGEVEQEVFDVKIPFTYRLGLIILKVNIAGEEYDFLLDTGAPNVISKELAKKLKLNNKTEQFVGDSQGASSKLGFTAIEKLSIGGIHFLNTGAVIADLKLSKNIGCLKIDGFIGSNLMRKAIWKFDYQNQLITIANSTESLDMPKSTHKIPFKTKVTGTPVIDIQLNGVEEKNVAVDLGSTGYMELSKKTLDALMRKNPSIPITHSFGSLFSGLYGYAEPDSTFYLRLPAVAFGDVSLENTIVSFSKKSAATVGTKFFKNYDLIIDWFANEILLVSKTAYRNSTLSNFGFSCFNQDDRLIVSNIYKNGEDLKLGDQILEINEVRYDKLLTEQWCEIMGNGLIGENVQDVSVVLLRDGKELRYMLKKVSLL